MNLKRFSIWAAAVALTGAVCTLSASAAVVDKVGPKYEGEYFIAYNDRISGYDRNEVSGSLPATPAVTSMVSLELFSAGMEEEVSDDVVNAFTDENGRTLYQVEPRNLDKLKPPVQTFALYNDRTDDPPQPGDEQSFITVDTNTSDTLRLPFILKYSGEHCNVWLEAEDARDITDEMVTELGMEYDFYIHHRMEKAFGPVCDINGDGKMAILLYDIQDEYSLAPDSADKYTGGFFLPADMTSEFYNCMDVLHIDTYPSIPDDGSLDRVKSTMVHELQHLIECSAQLKPSETTPGKFVKKCDEIPIWINEGLSMAAEHMLYGVLEDRISHYNGLKYTNMNIPLADWSRGNSLSHYSLSYLFIQYLRTQTKDFPGGGEEIYKRIITSGQRSGRCIEEAMRSFYPNITNSDIFRNFYIALTLKEDSGLFGFAGEEDFDAVQGRIHEGDWSQWLGCGAALVSHPGMGTYTAPSDASGRIRFAAFRPTAEGEETPVDIPVASEVNGEVYKFKYITLSCCEPYSTIYYTLNGLAPTPETGIVYTGRPIQILSDTQLKAITVAADGRQSEIASYKYTVSKDDFEFYRRTVGAPDVYDHVESTGAVPAPDGGYIQVGHVYVSDMGLEDFFDMRGHLNCSPTGYIIKYSATGEQKWIKTLSSRSQTRILCAAAADDGFVVAGDAWWGSAEDRADPDANDFIDALTPENESPEDLENAKSKSAFLAKYDWDGNLQWISAVPFIVVPGQTTSYSPTKYFQSVTTLRDSSGGVCGYAAAGEMANSGTLSTGSKAYIARFDVNGKLMWEKVLRGRENGGGGVFHTIAVRPDGNIIAAGEFHASNFGKPDGQDWADYPGEIFDSKYAPFAACYNAEDGSLLWKEAYYVDYYIAVWASDIVPLEDGGFIAACCNSESKVIMVRADAEGKQIWKKPLYTKDLGVFPAIAPAEDGVMVMYVINSKSSSVISQNRLTLIRKQGDYLAVKYDFDGNIRWAKNFSSRYQANISSSRADGTESLIRLNDRKYLVCSTAKRNDSGGLSSHGVLFTFYDESLPHYTVSGVIATEAGTPLPGVSVSYALTDDPQEYVVLTDSQGKYSFKVAQGSSVTLTPQLEGYTFTSVVAGGNSDTLEPVTAASPGHDFTAEIVKYTVSGTVAGLDGQGLSGIQVGPRPEDVTGEDGIYSIQVRAGTTLPLAPVSEEPDVIFEPVRRVLPAVSEDIAGQDFRVLPPQYTVSGKVAREDGTGQGGVLVGDVLTAPDGTYSITVDSGASLKLTPKFPQYVFFPAYHELENISADMPDQNFTMLREELTFRLEADPSPVEFEALTEGYAQPQAVTVTVTNVEGGPCVGVEAFLGEDSPFVLTPITRDTLVVGDGGATFTVRPKAGLAKGEYTAQVWIRQGETVHLTVPVSFAVKEKFTPQEPDKPTPPPTPPTPPPTPPAPPASSGSDDTPQPAPKPELEPVYLDHLPYIVGYPDGTFRTENDLTRGQCAAILARLSEDFDPEKTYPQGFSDVPGSRWYADSIGFLTAKKVIHGYPDGTFRPDAPITRAEFVTLLCNVLRPESPAENPFPDADGHWAVYYIARLTQAGILDGYPDGTFRPDVPITRAEAVKSVNRAYARTETVPQFKAAESPFPDLENTYWAYYEILEASIKHRVQK